LINDPRQPDVKFFVLDGLLSKPENRLKGGGMKTISSIVADTSFKSIFCLSLSGLVASFGLMAFGMDLTSIWL
jgi:hypothetical protein